MKDEVSKDTPKQLKARNAFKGKLKEAGIEVFIIVFSILLSLSLDNWNEERLEKKNAKEFLIEIVEDLKNDVHLMEENKSKSARLAGDSEFLLSLKKDDQYSDEMIGPHTSIETLSSNFNVARYEGFKSSGKIGTIGNVKLKNNLLTYYQQTLPDLVFRAGFLFNEHSKILAAAGDAEEHATLNEIYTQRKIKGMHNFVGANYSYAIKAYEKAIIQANQMIAAIEKETKD
jgi:hypothetical protein